MKQTRRPTIPRDVKLDEYRQLIGYITANGGYAVDAAKALGLKVKLHDFRVFAKSLGFVLKDYALAWKRYGHWLTLPGPYRSEGKSRYIVPAMCLLCGNTYELNLINAKTGKSTCCKSCSHNYVYPKSVINISTGEIYRSIMSWTKSIDCFKQYQSLRIAIQQQQVEIDGVKYCLVADT